MDSPIRSETILETKGIYKQFPKVLANKDINIRLAKGEILSLLGENGAGKSTLMNMLYGLYRPTSGSILLNGKEVVFHSPKDAIRSGLGMVHQHFMLVDTLTVTENIILGTEPGKGGVIDYRKARDEVISLSRTYRLEIDPDAKIESISVGLQQRVEILKALYRKARILILDEPTAVLTPQEVEDLFVVIRKLIEGGVSIIIITHKLEEVKAIADRVYVLRRGEMVGERRTADVTTQELANLMVGRDVVLTVQKEKKKIAVDPVFTIDQLTVKSDKGNEALHGISLSVRPGEIVGLAGVDGNGQAELADALMGLRKVESGSVVFNGVDVTRLPTKMKIERKVSYVPADRQKYGLVLPMKISENMVIGYHDKPPFCRRINLDLGEIDSYSKNLVRQFDIRTPSVSVTASTLSGGNQQKAIIAREFSRDPRFLLVNQPTRGVDVGAIEYIHRQILDMRNRDVAILLISLELEEIFALSDRILVIYEGRIVRELVPEETSDREVGLYMTGGRDKERA